MDGYVVLFVSAMRMRTGVATVENEFFTLLKEWRPPENDNDGYERLAK